MVPAVQIDVDDADGGIVFDNTSTVALAVASGPAGGVMSGVTSVKAVQGTATFSGLKFSKPGKYTIKATDGSLTSVTSQMFNVTSVGATKLVFGVQPSDIAVGKPISPAVTVKVEDADGNVVTTDNSDVIIDLTGSIPVGASLGGDTIVQAVNGVATFDKLDVNMRRHLYAQGGRRLPRHRNLGQLQGQFPAQSDQARLHRSARDDRGR